MIIKAPEIIPGQDDGRVRSECRVAHDGVHALHGPVLTLADTRWRVIPRATHEPAHRRQRASSCIRGKLIEVHHMRTPVGAIANVLDCVVG